MPNAEHLNVLNKLPHCTPCSWNTLITCQIKSGMSHQALNLYQQMPKDDFVHITGHTYVTLLKACTKLRNLNLGLFIHADVARVGLLECDLFIGNTLIDLYAKLCLPEKAQQVFDKLPQRDVISWTTLMSGYVEDGHGEVALEFFEVMKQEDVTPNAVTYICILKACGGLRAVNKGREVHDEVERHGLLKSDLLVCSSLVDMYAKCGMLKIASQVFDKVPLRDAVSWTALIAGYVEHGYAEEAFGYFQHMQLEGVSPNSATFVCILKACGSVGAIATGNKLHSTAEREGFLKDPLAVNALIGMYVKLGLLTSAQEVFDNISVRDVVSWTTLIAGYAEGGQGQKALECYEKMEHTGISPNPATLVCSLKACGSTGDVHRGWKLHSEIERRGLLKEGSAVGNALVDMYAKCGLFLCAQQVFEKLRVRDVVSWNALITSFAEHEYAQEALQSFERMYCEGVFPDIITFVYALKSCASIGATGTGRKIHAEIERQGLMDRELVIGNTLIQMYADCGLLAIAQQVFDKLSSKNAVSWNVLMGGYAERGLGEEALACFEEMQLRGVSPSPCTFICSLKACASTGLTEWGRELHSKIERQGLFEEDIVVGNSLLTMYAKCGLLERAAQVFDKLPVQNVTSWNALMTGYVQHGYGSQALNCFDRMRLHGVWPNISTLICSLKACGILRDSERGLEIHAEVESYGLLEKELAASNTLVHMYAKCGLLNVAQQVFNKLQSRDFVTWAALIAGYAEHCFCEEVLSCFDQMLKEGFFPTAAAFVCYLKSCGKLRALEEGTNLHAEIERRFHLDGNPILGNSVVGMYMKNGLLSRAQEVFSNLSRRDVVSWNIMIAGFADNGLWEEALRFLKMMQLEGVLPDALTFVSFLRACEIEGALSRVEELHAEIESSIFLKGDIMVSNALVHLYAKCGCLSRTQQIFDKYQGQGIDSWNKLMEGYAYYEQNVRALKSFECLQLAGACPDTRTFICSLNACRDLGAISKGEELHGEVEKRGLLHGEPHGEVGNTLVSMYAKCGHLADACRVFDRLHIRDVVSWTALMSGYAKLGQTADVFKIFNSMVGEGTKPDSISVLVALRAYNFLGFPSGEDSFFEAIANQYGIVLPLDHYSRIAKFFSHLGQLDTAVNIIETRPSCHKIVMWDMLLDACKMVGSEQFGELAFKCGLLREKTD